MSPTSRIKTNLTPTTRTANRVTRSQSLNRSTVSNAIPLASSRSTPRSTTTRGRPRRGGARRTSTSITPASETGNQSGENTNVELPTQEPTPVNLPVTPENNNTQVQVVDLITPQPTASNSRHGRRPLEVDLTCDLDDEVFVVLEDIVNPSRRTHPVMLGPSPPKTRVLPRYTRPTLGATIHTAQQRTLPRDVEMCCPLDGEPKAASTSSPSTFNNQDQSSESSVAIHCPICLDSLSQVKAANQQMHSTTCGHLFCGPCIMRVLAATQQCPTCRKRLDVRKIHPIFI